MPEFEIWEKVLYKVPGESPQAALETFLEAEDQNAFFQQVDDRWVFDENGDQVEVDD